MMPMTPMMPTVAMKVLIRMSERKAHSRGSCWQFLVASSFRRTERVPYAPCDVGMFFVKGLGGKWLQEVSRTEQDGGGRGRCAPRPIGLMMMN